MSAETRYVRPLDLLLILGSLLFGSSGQVLMRMGMADLGGGSLIATILSGIAQPAVLLGLACYVASTLLWLVVLSRVPLSTAYPFGALNYVLIVLVALATGEHVGLLRWAGVVLIVGGILLVSGGASRGEAQ